MDSSIAPASSLRSYGEAADGSATGRLLDDIRRLVLSLQANAGMLDRQSAVPVADLLALRDAGALLAPLPTRHGGFGFGTEPGGAEGLFDALRLIGRGNLAVGRLFEGHVNAIQLITRYGNETQIAQAAIDSAQGHLFAIWNTEASPGVRLGTDGRLTGRKMFCSAAGYATRAVITVDHPHRSRMLIASLDAGERVDGLQSGLHGMRATCTGSIDFTGYSPDPAHWIGGEGDYLREPLFSGGAWRTLAVLVGGIEAMVDALRRQLRERGREAAPHQAMRIAEALIAQETATLWTRKAAALAETGNCAPFDITSYVNLARGAVDAAGRQVIQLVETSLGLAAFVNTNPVERLRRDLATYLRQPAMDEGLTEAAAHFVAGPIPSERGGCR